MNTLSKLRERLKSQDTSLTRGEWRPIKICLDEDTGEFLNAGVMFQHSAGVEVRMLDNFERLQCLYDKRINTDNLNHMLIDIEETIRHHKGVFADSIISNHVHLGPSRFAAGHSPESVVNEFFSDVVTLGRTSTKTKGNNFVYQSSQKTRDILLTIMRQKMFLDAERIIQNEPYFLKLRNGERSLPVDIPLLSASAASTIVSAWYKSPMVVENNILHASTDLILLSSNDYNIQNKAVSVLMPDKNCGMSATEFSKHQDVANNQIDRLQNCGIQVITAGSSDVLADETVKWWQKQLAA